MAVERCSTATFNFEIGSAQHKLWTVKVSSEKRLILIPYSDNTTRPLTGLTRMLFLPNRQVALFDWYRLCTWPHALSLAPAESPLLAAMDNTLYGAGTHNNISLLTQCTYMHAWIAIKTMMLVHGTHFLCLCTSSEGERVLYPPSLNLRRL